MSEADKTKAAEGSAKQREKDRRLFGELVRAQKASLIVISANAERLNYPGSPVWSPGENLAPLLAIFSLSAVLTFVVNALVGLAVIVLGVVLHILLVRPWI